MVKLYWVYRMGQGGVETSAQATKQAVSSLLHFTGRLHKLRDTLLDQKPADKQEQWFTFQEG